MKEFALPKKNENKGKVPAKKSQGNKTKSRPIQTSIDHILHLQQTIGNQAVQRMIKSGELQLKDNRPQPGDVYSREIQALARRVQHNLPEQSKTILESERNEGSLISVPSLKFTKPKPIKKTSPLQNAIKDIKENVSKIPEITQFQTSKSTGVIQMDNVLVGFDRMAVAGAGDTLTTSGLGNCIAVVAYDTSSRTAVMAHYNTINAFKLPNDFSEESLAKLKQQLDKRLAVAAKKAVKPEYHLALGGVWYNVAGTKTDFMRHNLILALLNVFGTEVTVAGVTVQFDVNSATIRGDKSNNLKIKMPQGWGSKGEEM